MRVVSQLRSRKDRFGSLCRKTPIFSFLAAWVAKVGQLTCKINELSANNDKVCLLIAQCTNLQRAEVHENPRVLEAVLMHRVSKVTIRCGTNAAALTAPIAR